MKRRKAREMAMQLLFAADLQETSPERLAEFRADRLIRDYQQNFGPNLSPNIVDEAYLLRVLQGALGSISELDGKIEATSEHWKMHRMSRVDRNILRLGAYELLHVQDTPPKVVLDEAVELAKKFGTEDSPAFVNGLLDHLRFPEKVDPSE